jgi:UPF0176 protein
MKALHNRVDSRVLKTHIQESTQARITISFYRYAKILNPNLFRDHLYLLLTQIEVLGRIYIAKEGINAQISVPKNQLTALRKYLDDIVFLRNCRLNQAVDDDGKSFFKLSIKIRDKIVADGITDENFDVSENAKHIGASEFNRLADDKENTIIIDMRNHYESEVGHFKNAIRPDVETFRESLPIIEKILEQNSEKNILMYCTGGIRCEKATAYYRYKGFENLYQLDGGIIEYTHQAKQEGLENKFVGKNFVFDERLGERISSDIIAKCHQCGDPCDEHTNCINEACHILFIQCKSCAEKYSKCCSIKCSSFMKLTLQERKSLYGIYKFNGTKFGKGRYKAVRSESDLSNPESSGTLP